MAPGDATPHTSAAAPTWEGALDAGAEAPPAVDAAQLEAVAQAVESPAVPASAPVQTPTPGLTGDVSTPQPGGLWSKRRISKAKGSDLRRYVAELQARVPPPPGEGAPGEAAPAALTEADKLANLTAALAATFPMAGRAMVKLFKSDAMLIDKDESRELAEAWAPLALPHYDEIVKGMPWAVALGKTYEIGEPKVTKMLEERAAAKARADANAAPAGDASAL